MKRVLIFTAGFGEGHNSAARNIHDALEFLGGDEVHVEILDLFETCYKRLNEFAKKTYLAAINETPRLWRGFYALLDNSSLMEGNLVFLSKMRRALGDLLREADPDVVVTVYPVYNYLLDDLFGAEPRPFSVVTAVTDSISINSFWYRARADYFLVANDATADVLKRNGIEAERIRVLGFPVPIAFADSADIEPLPDPREERRVLYVINSGRKRAPKVVERLLELEDVRFTITVGKSAELLDAVKEITAGEEKRVKVMGWTTLMPKLLMTHHTVISKAGGATTQEAIAARCPMVVNQIVPGQEEGNFELLQMAGAGIRAEKPKEIRDAVENLFAHDAREWRRVREALTRISVPDASLKIARFLLDEAVPRNAPPRRLASLPVHADARRTGALEKRLLLCDLHTHTTFSDGQLAVPELVDFYGQRGFDVLCITDHLVDHATVIGRVVKRTGLVLGHEDLPEYFDVIAKQKARALRKYGMIVLTGLEFNKDGITSKTSTHLLGVDLREPIDPSMDLKSLIAAIHAQDGLAIASHPHEFKVALGRNTLFLWENQEEYAPLIDAWEIANRDDFFNPVGLKRLPFVANSDFHKPKHIYSWKTMLYCAKDPEAIKDCVRRNRDVAITLFRDHRFGYGFEAGAEARSERELMLLPRPALAAG